MKIKIKKKISVHKIVALILVGLILFQDSIDVLGAGVFIRYIDEILILLYFFYALIKCNGKFGKEVITILSLGFVFWIIGIVSCLINSEYDMYSLVMESLLMLKFILLLSGVALRPPKCKTVMNLLWAVKIYGGLSFVTGIINFLMPTIWTTIIPYTWISYRIGIVCVMGLFVHPSQYGWFMLFVALIYYAEYKQEKNSKSLQIFIMYSIAALLSFKVKVIVSFLVIIMMDYYVLGKHKVNLKKLFSSIALCIIIGIIFGNLIIDNIILYFTNQSNGMTARYALLIVALKIMRDYFPLGVGFGKFGSWYASVNYSEYYYAYGLNEIYGLQPGNANFATDTFWPSIWGETGFLGTIVYMLILVFIFSCLMKKYWELEKQKIYGNYNKIMLIALYGFLQAVVESMAEQIFNNSPKNIFLGFAVGIGLYISSGKHLKGTYV